VLSLLTSVVKASPGRGKDAEKIVDSIGFTTRGLFRLNKF